jgi:hypothetical protein
MNNLNKTLLTLLLLVTSVVLTYTFMEQSYVKVETTKSGKFIIDNQRIYELVELDKPEPFINSYKNEAVR